MIEHALILLILGWQNKLVATWTPTLKRVTIINMSLSKDVTANPGEVSSPPYLRHSDNAVVVFFHLHDNGRLHHVFWLRQRRQEQTCCREPRAMHIHGGGQATSEQSSPNGSKQIFRVCIRFFLAYEKFSSFL